MTENDLDIPNFSYNDIEVIIQNNIDPNNAHDDKISIPN